ncbi:MAG: class I SAM-dependent methyltransferase [Bdellovibrionales bacterium]|nr:class I SAM-dependent methyltransferase [Bdellovibrionales bacterium]
MISFISLALISLCMASLFIVVERSQLYGHSFLHQLQIEYFRWLYRLNDFYRDRQAKIHSSQRIKKEKLKAPEYIKTHAKAYEPTPYAVLDRVFSKLTPYEKNYLSFVDYGCGRGRTLSMAYRQGFKNLYGVDIDEELVQDCRKNLKNTHANFNTQIFHLSADDYLPPSGDKIIFLYNPFDEDMLRSSLHNIKQTTGENLIIYVNPVAQNIFKEFGAEFVRHYPHPYEDFSFSVYRLKSDNWVSL